MATAEKKPRVQRAPEESWPESDAELKRALAIFLTRSEGISDFVFGDQVAIPAGGMPVFIGPLGGTTNRLVIPTTDFPETQGFALRLQHHPLDPVGNAVRYIVNNNKEVRRGRVLAEVTTHGNILQPGYVEEVPIRRKRWQPIIVDLFGEIGDSRVIVSVWTVVRANQVATI